MMRTSQGACLATSPAIEPSTRAAPCTRSLPTAITEALSRTASAQSAFAGLPMMTVCVTGVEERSSPASACSVWSAMLMESSCQRWERDR